MNNVEEQTRARIVEVAEAVLTSQLDLVSGCRELTALCHILPPESLPIFYPVIGFESETDDYPLGDVRQQFGKDYLERMDKRIKEYSERSRPWVLAACREIVKQFTLGSLIGKQDVKPLLANQAVRIRGGVEWKDGTRGIITKPPDLPADLPAALSACLREYGNDVFRDTMTPKGKVRFYWVRFDEPQFDCDGDGPYSECAIEEEYLVGDS
jgi:hypothetical protein